MRRVVGLLALCLGIAIRHAAAAGPPVALNLQNDHVTLRTDSGQLRVSARCPRFAFERVTVGGDVAESPANGQIGSGRPVELSFSPLRIGDDARFDVRLILQWSSAENVLRKWARFRLSGNQSFGILREIVLERLSTGSNAGLSQTLPSQPDGRTFETVLPSEADPQSRPVFLDGFFLGVEFPISTTRASGGQTVLAHCPGLKVEPGVWYETRKAVYGVARRGEERQAFQRYIAAHRPTPRGLHFNYNAWWTSPVPYDEDDILGLMDVLYEKLYRPHGVSFDSFCIDLGWADPSSLWDINRELFPEGFTRIAGAAARMQCHPGLWISPSGAYTGLPGAMNNDWVESQGFETFRAPGRDGPNSRWVCLGGSRYRSGLQQRLVEMVTRYGVRQIKFDGYRFACPNSDHGHAPGPLSVEAIAEGMISVFDAVRQADPDVWIEATCFYWNPSPWWLFHVNSVIGTYGDDAPSGRVPCPVYRESYTTARDFFNLQGAAQLPIPIGAQEVLGIIHQSPEPFMNDAIMSVMRGHEFLPAYLNPAYMNEARWKAFADLVKWARRNTDTLAETQPLLPRAWSNGNVPGFSGEPPMPHEPYGYAHWNGTGGLVAIRNPCIAPQTFALELPRISGASSPHSVLAAVSLYPQVRLYGHDLNAGDTLQVPLAPYETVVLSVGPRQPLPGVPTVMDAIGHRIRVTNTRCTVVRARAENSSPDGPFGPDWTDVLGGLKSPIQLRLEADVEVNAAEAALLIILSGPKPPATPLCRVFVDGRESSVSGNGPETGWNMTGEVRHEHWLVLRAPLSAKKQSIRLELFVGSEAMDISTWVWATDLPRTDGPSDPNALPAPELISVDGARICDPVDTTKIPADAVPSSRPVERINGIFLDAVEPLSVVQGWGSLERNKSVAGKPMTIAGNRYLRGLGTYAPSRIAFSLGGEYRRFQSWAGGDGAAVCSVSFEVWLDGQRRWESGPMTQSAAARRVDLDVTGVKMLELVVGEGGDGHTSDHANWAEAQLLR